MILHHRASVAEKEEKLASKLGGMDALARARARDALDGIVDARAYLNAERNLGLLFQMMADVESDPRAVLVAREKCVCTLHKKNSICDLSHSWTMDMDMVAYIILVL
jgi:hypothetical protein